MIKVYKLHLLLVTLVLFFSGCSFAPKKLPPPFQPPPAAFIPKPAPTPLTEFEGFLETHHCHSIVPAQHLWRQGTDWKKVNQPQHAMPPKEMWGNIVPLLHFINEEIIPLIGEVEVVSGFRTPAFNHLAAGAKRSRHLYFQAVDIIPKQAYSREELHSLLLQLWKQKGQKYKLGLGLYKGVRFHIDSFGYRKWGG